MACCAGISIASRFADFDNLRQRSLSIFSDYLVAMATKASAKAALNDAHMAGACRCCASRGRHHRNRHIKTLGWRDNVDRTEVSEERAEGRERHRPKRAAIVIDAALALGSPR